MVGMPRRPTLTSSSSSSRSTRTAPASPAAASSRPRRTHRPGGPTTTWRRPSRPRSCSPGRPREDRDAAARAPAAAAHLGPGAQLVQGPQGRRPDDQRPGRVGRRQAGLRPRAAPPGAAWCRRGGGTSGRSHRRRSTRRASRASSRSSPHGPTAPASRWPGLYEFWRDPAIADPDDPMAWLTTFTVITGPAEPGLDRIHDRQPLVLEPEEWATWLDPRHRRRRRAGPARGAHRPGASRPTPSPPP